jgi:hypothetical protein
MQTALPKKSPAKRRVPELEGNMPKYQCHFLGDSKSVVRIESLGSCDCDSDAHRQAMTLLVKVGHFSGYELWEDGRKVEAYTPVKAGSAV